LSHNSGKTEGVVEDIIELVRSINWYHSIDLGNGIITPGAAGKLTNLIQTMGAFPDVRGKSVLDIGAWDGYYSFLAEKMGAARILATDSYVWQGRVGKHSDSGFKLAQTVLKSKVESKLIDVMDIGKKTCDVFDVIQFFGVLYHLQDPMRALRNIRDVCSELLALETLIYRPVIETSSILYFSGSSLNDDPTNYFVPTAMALKGMLSDTGFRVVRTFVGPRKSLAKAAVQALFPGYIFGYPLCRCVVHAVPI
jgi:tRNA (mo5U34)-methyltransferase